MTSLLYDFLLLCWTENKLTEAHIQYAVEQGWITNDEALGIIATPK